MNNYLLFNQRPQLAGALNVNSKLMDYNVNVPISLMKSIEGKYFVGTAPNLRFGNVTNAWARLYNPTNSGVNLFVNTWTVSDIFSTPYSVQIWFNSTPPGLVQFSQFVTPSNLTITPQPQSHIQLQYAIAVSGLPAGGMKAYGRYGLAGTTIVSEEEGKFIFAPGGSYLIFISNPERPTVPASGNIAFGWWEEPIWQ
ncbi:MAG TPA: hypothetical protein DC024_06145 [Clostridiales bacterium]|jgi:hypothetical protein|nr:hypothetical protein [Clostridiales bacterium]HCS10731.1 hypothetical protein [Clostridiales bacterium]